MLKIAVIFFALGAVLGLTILINWLNKKEASKAVIYSHGLVGAIGLALLAYYGMQHPDNFPKLSLILFVIVAIVGFYMFFTTDMGNPSNKPKPVLIAIIHGLVAVSSFVLLLYSVFS